MYPVMLNIEGRRCLVVGGGGVALRKVQGLVAERADVTVVTPEAVETIAGLAREGRIQLELRPYRAGEAADYQLVFTATDRREVNQQVYEDAERVGVWANAADEPDICSFHLPARVQRGSLQLAIASGGEAPFAVRRLRQLLERRFGPEWAEWEDAAARFRNRIRALDLDPEEQEECYDRFFRGTLDGVKLTARVPSEREERAWSGCPLSVAGEPASHTAPQQASDAMPTPGTVSLVGSGPGCAGLMTLRGRERLMRADAVVYDRLAAAALPSDLPASVELHCVGKTAGHHPVPQQQINDELVRLAREGKRVVRLKGGDPYVFGRGAEELEALHAEGISFDVVPGVTSGVAAPAWMGVPVTTRGEAVRVTLVTAHESAKSQGSQVRWDLLAQDEGATIVGYMGLTTLPRVVQSLLDGGMRATMPAAMVEQGTTAMQRSVVSTLVDLPAAVAREGLQAPALFVVGPTVKHAGTLDWFSRLPLAGERLILPASSAGMTPELEAAGAEVVTVPTPLTPAARVVIGAAPVTGCVLRSPAEAEWLDDEREGNGWERGPVVWCLNRETAERARALGWRHVEEVPSGEDSPDLAAWIGRHRHRAA